MGCGAEPSGPSICYWSTGEGNDEKTTLGFADGLLHLGVPERH